MRREGKVIPMEHTEAVEKGQIVLKDGFAMVALNKAAENELIAYGVAGSYDFKGATSHTLKAGDKAFYNESEKTVSQTTSDVFIGRVACVEQDTVEVVINTGI